MSVKNDSLKACFIHIPKNAGMSIESIIGGCGHASAQELFGVDNSPFDWRISAIVRNPYDRAVSVWAHGLQVSDTPFRWPDRFSDFVRQLPSRLWEVHARPQWSFLINKSGIAANFIGRFEQLGDAYQQICRFHEIDPAPELPHENASQRNHWRDYYDYDLIQIINRLYWQDFSWFGYSTL